ESCPGLRKYGEDISSTRGEFAGERVFGTQEGYVKLKVAERPKLIPNDYRACGHTCYLDISPDGRTLSISKDAASRCSWTRWWKRAAGI
ncbi:MAG TPA: hypothetical protein VNX25_08385, partial [Verrucomicrobiae bacterium]|nr:hypothetical protein [Verrucomicrobiae bacterium]